MISFVLIGILVGFLSGFFGIGGGTILVPILLYMGFDIKSAIGISVMQMLFSSIFGSYINFKSAFLNLKDGFVIGIGGLCGAFFSGFLVTHLSSKTLGLMFLGFLTFAIYRFFKAHELNTQSIITKANKAFLFLIGLGIGAVAISIGVGGSLILTPLLVGYFGYELKKAASMGLFFVIFSSFSGFISLSLNGHIDYNSGIIIGLGSLVGVFIGVKSAHIIPNKNYRVLILLLYIILLILSAKKILF